MFWFILGVFFLGAFVGFCLAILIFALFSQNCPNCEYLELENERLRWELYELHEKHRVN